jgi:RNA polymerase sigma-70 factor (ECF subfamily)
MISNILKTFESYLAAARRKNFAFAMSLTRNAEDAEDLVQDAQLRALRALETLKSDQVPDPWFRQIMKNCFIDTKRYHSRRPQTTSLEAIQEGNPNFDVADPAAEQLLQVGDDVEIKVLREALDELAPPHRDLILATLSGQTCRDLCKKLKCREITVRSRLQQAHRLLRRQLLASQLQCKQLPSA